MENNLLCKHNNKPYGYYLLCKIIAISTVSILIVYKLYIIRNCNLKSKIDDYIEQSKSEICGMRRWLYILPSTLSPPWLIMNENALSVICGVPLESRRPATLSEGKTSETQLKYLHCQMQCVRNREGDLRHPPPRVSQPNSISVMIFFFLSLCSYFLFLRFSLRCARYLFPPPSALSLFSRFDFTSAVIGLAPIEWRWRSRSHKSVASLTPQPNAIFMSPGRRHVISRLLLLIVHHRRFLLVTNKDRPVCVTETRVVSKMTHTSSLAKRIHNSNMNTE